jgi:hypothetical protein
MATKEGLLIHYGVLGMHWGQRKRSREPKREVTEGRTLTKKLLLKMGLIGASYVGSQVASKMGYHKTSTILTAVGWVSFGQLAVRVNNL